MGRADKCKPVTGKHSLRDKSNGNGVRLINCASVSNMVIGGRILEHNNEYSMSKKSPYLHYFNQTDHLLVDDIYLSNVMVVSAETVK